MESHFCANGSDRLAEKIDDVISQASGAGFFCRETGGDQILCSSVPEIDTADPHHYRLMLEIFPLNVVGARYLVYCQMTTGHTQLFRLTAGNAQLSLLKVAAQPVGSSLKPEDAPHVGLRLKLHWIRRWFDQLLNVT